MPTLKRSDPEWKADVLDCYNSSGHHGDYDVIEDRVLRARDADTCETCIGPILDSEEIDRLLVACPPHLCAIVVCALHTGMRRGEILGLTWDRVDMKQRFIHLEKTKTRKARTIPINDPLMDALRRLPRNLGTEYVFWNHETATRFVSIKRAWSTALKKAKITRFRFHDLRHTFASHVQMGLGDLRATQALLGHADPRMTMRYAHLSDARLREAVKGLGHLGTGAIPGATSVAAS